MRAIVSEKGQITIPKRLRQSLGIRPGQALEFEEKEGQLVARKASDRDPVDDLFGILPLQEDVDSFVADLRDAPSG